MFMSLSIWVHSGDRNHRVRVLLPGVCTGISTETNAHTVGERKLTLGHTEGPGYTDSAGVLPCVLLELGSGEAFLCKNLRYFWVPQAKGSRVPYMSSPTGLRRRCAGRNLG